MKNDKLEGLELFRTDRFTSMTPAAAKAAAIPENNVGLLLQTEGLNEEYSRQQDKVPVRIIGVTPFEFVVEYDSLSDVQRDIRSSAPNCLALYGWVKKTVNGDKTSYRAFNGGLTKVTLNKQVGELWTLDCIVAIDVCSTDMFAD